MVCKCGCKKKTTIYRGISREFIHGHNRPWLGRKRSLEDIKKLRAGGFFKPNSYWLGKKRSKETNIKISITNKLRGVKPSREAQLNSIKAQQQKSTSIEKAVYDYLLLKGILFEKQKMVGNRFVVDAYIPSLNLIIEADGTYWHSRPEVIKRDKRKNKYLKEQGFDLIRLSEDKINNKEFIDILKELL